MAYYKESEWANLDVYIDGNKITGLRGLSYTETDEDTPLYGAGKEPISIQSGNTSYKGEVKLFKNELDALTVAAKAAGYASIKNVPNLVIVAVYKPDQGRVLRTDTLLGCKIGEIPRAMEQGSPSMEITLPFQFLSLKTA